MKKEREISKLGRLEENVGKKIRISKIQSALIATVATAGILAVAGVAPGAFQIMRITGLDKKLRRRKQSSISRAKSTLVDNGLLSLVETSHGKALKLTQKGEALYQKIEIGNFQLRKTIRWDKKWRVIIFDINEKRKIIREELRNVLNKFGFLRIQDSSYLSPYKCDELVTLIKKNYKLDRAIIYMIVDEIENDSYYKKYFNLR